jgi:hypothetical protein
MAANIARRIKFRIFSFLISIRIVAARNKKRAGLPLSLTGYCRAGGQKALSSLDSPPRIDGQVRAP